jgi:hypothetical protein
MASSTLRADSGLAIMSSIHAAKEKMVVLVVVVGAERTEGERERRAIMGMVGWSMVGGEHDWLLEG